MCGIAGALRLRADAPQLIAAELETLRDSMASRGPDDRGLWLDASRSVGLAHRRLAIIDLSAAGHQPMEDPQTGNRIVFNGEIYNFRALAAELKAAGCEIRTSSDTEVILHLYRREGVAALRRLRGMFALAIWDAHEEALVLARDPYGIKPLYFAESDGAFVFGSQVRALRKVAGLRGRPPLLAAEIAFFLFGYVPEPLTFFEGISAVPAGSWLRVDRRGIAKAVQFASITETLERAAQSPVRAPPTARSQIREALEDSVRHHLVADVPVGVFLSAGRDSAVIAAVASRMTTGRLRTVTLAFDEFAGTPADEAPIAEATAAALGTEHRTVRLTGADFESELGRGLDAMDQPTIDGLNVYFVSKAAAESGLKVVLSGLGGDELFGGYSHFRTLPKLASLLRPLRRFEGIGRGIRSLAAPVLSRFTSPKYAGVVEYGTSIGGAYLLSRSLFAPWELPRIFGPDKAREGLAVLVEQAGLPTTDGLATTAHAQLVGLDSVWYMRNQLLRDADWASMAHSLEVRLPFVDYALLDRLAPMIVGTEPPGKDDLTAPFRSALPADVFNRPKSGFGIPLNRWLRNLHTRQSGAESGAPWRERGLRPWAFHVYKHFIQNV